MPPFTFSLKPSNFLLRTKLATPATASEPQEAEAPPVTMSTRCSSIWGISLISTTPCVEVGMMRSPSIMTRVRWVPTPRMFSVERPLTPLELPPLPKVAPVEPCSEGSSVMVVKTLGLACFSISCALNTVVGVGASKPLLMMREDDTVTDSTPSCWACAKAGAEINMARTAVLLDSARRRFAQPAFSSKNMILSPVNVPASLF